MCLLSANPLALAELDCLVRRVRGIRVRRTLLGLEAFLSSREVRMPIRAELDISESTVKCHLARLFEKFGVRRRSDLILQTVQQTAAVVH